MVHSRNSMSRILLTTGMNRKKEHCVFMDREHEGPNVKGPRLRSTTGISLIGQTKFFVSKWNHVESCTQLREKRTYLTNWTSSLRPSAKSGRTWDELRLTPDGLRRTELEVQTDGLVNVRTAQKDQPQPNMAVVLVKLLLFSSRYQICLVKTLPIKTQNISTH